MVKKSLLLLIVLCLSLGASLAMAAPDPLFNWAKTPTTLTFYGQSTFVLTHGEARIVIDPWLQEIRGKRLRPMISTCSTSW